MVSSAVKKYAALCMVCLCSSLFFLGLYQFNNKYSQNTTQAANGILALSEAKDTKRREQSCGFVRKNCRTASYFLQR